MTVAGSVITSRQIGGLRNGLINPKYADFHTLVELTVFDRPLRIAVILNKASYFISLALS